VSAPAKPPRKRVQAMAQGRGQGERVVIPLAFDTAASITARPLEEFHHDPTQLANGLLELHRAIAADGLCVALADGFEYASADGGALEIETLCAAGTRVAASLEACRRLRATLGDGAALLAGLTGPATLARQFGVDETTAGAAFTVLVKRYCEAGCDLILACESRPADDEAAWTDALKTAANIARFHRAHALLRGVPGPLAAPVGVVFEVGTSTDEVGTSTEVGTSVNDIGTSTNEAGNEIGTPIGCNPGTPTATGDCNPGTPTAMGVVVTAAVVAPQVDLEALRRWVAMQRG